MSMIEIITKHENYMREILDSNNDSYNWERLINYNKTRIQFFQHERLIHLLVTLCFGCLLLLSVFFATLLEKIVFIPLIIMFLVLVIPYIIHYYKLENMVQRLYIIDKELFLKRGLQ